MVLVHRVACMICGQSFVESCHGLIQKVTKAENFSNLWNAQTRKISDYKTGHTVRKPKKLPVKIQGEIVFGVHPVQLALMAKKRKFHRLYIKETPEPTGTESYINLSMLAEGLVEKTWVSKYFLDKLADGRPHQGICLDASPLTVPQLDLSKHVTIRQKENGSFPVWLLPYRVKDPQNLGAVLRSSYYLGVDHVVIPTVHTCPLLPMVSKASSGAMEISNISQVKSDKAVLELIQKWKTLGGKVIGATLAEDVETVPIDQYKIGHPTLLIVGNEEKGIKHKISASCDTNVYIKPADNTLPLMDSLNVSVATGILLYHLTK